MTFPMLARLRAYNELTIDEPDTYEEEYRNGKQRQRPKRLARSESLPGLPPRSSPLATKWIRWQLRANEQWLRVSSERPSSEVVVIKMPLGGRPKDRVTYHPSSVVVTRAKSTAPSQQQALRPFIFAQLPTELRERIWRFYFQGVVVHTNLPTRCVGKAPKLCIRQIDEKDDLLDMAGVSVCPSNARHFEPVANFCTRERLTLPPTLGAAPCKEDYRKALSLSRQTREDAGYVFASRCQFVFSSLRCFRIFMDSARRAGSKWPGWIRDLEIFTDFSDNHAAIPPEMIHLLTLCVSLRKVSISMFNRAPDLYNLLRVELHRSSPADGFQMSCHHRNNLMCNNVVPVKIPQEQRQAEQLRILQWVRGQGSAQWGTHLRKVDRPLYRVGTLHTFKKGQRVKVDATITGLGQIMPMSERGIEEALMGDHWM